MIRVRIPIQAEVELECDVTKDGDVDGAWLVIGVTGPRGVGLETRCVADGVRTALLARYAAQIERAAADVPENDSDDGRKA